MLRRFKGRICAAAAADEVARVRRTADLGGAYSGGGGGWFGVRSAMELKEFSGGFCRVGNFNSNSGNQKPWIRFV
ncbi:UNVERIFIED_CONTAM: hypothetical protein Sradi_4844600 [Sesamum radiatum]|uniref:Uncharacterized protein n=1 Tax=Sesamum radiatum TaxID=300843 RepID=A0AAW2N0K5_SESRA